MYCFVDRSVFFLAFVLSVLQFMDSDYPFGIYLQTLLKHIKTYYTVLNKDTINLMFVQNLYVDYSSYYLYVVPDNAVLIIVLNTSVVKKL